jgi:glycosyltransferase involved in cell wall biosynthesis
MSAYNNEKHLKEAVNSILSQTYTNFEFIIINDGSNDNCLDILLEYQKNNNQVLIIDQKNIGLTKSLNRGIQLARGKYIARQDADDKSFPERIEKQVQFLEANTDYFLIGTDYKIIDEFSNIIGKPEIPVPIDNHEIKAAINKYNPFIHSLVIFRNDNSTTRYLYDTSYKYSQDYELWIRILEHHNGYNLPEVLGLSRTWPRAISQKKIKTQRRYALRVKKQIMLKHITNIGFWCYLLKDLSVVYLPKWARQVYRRIKILP